MKLDDSLGFILNHTGRRVTQLLNLRLQPYEITSEQFSILRRLCEQDGISQKELAMRVAKDPTNVTRILDQLERKGLVERMANPEDRRSFLAFVTDAGRSLDRTFEPIEDEVITSIHEGLDPTQIRQLINLLKQLEANATRQLERIER